MLKAAAILWLDEKSIAEIEHSNDRRSERSESVKVGLQNNINKLKKWSEVCMTTSLTWKPHGPAALRVLVVFKVRLVRSLSVQFSFFFYYFLSFFRLKFHSFHIILNPTHYSYY